MTEQSSQTSRPHLEHTPAASAARHISHIVDLHTSHRRDASS